MPDMPENEPREMESLASKLGLSFEDIDLLRLAFVHGSYANENADSVPESNERLEFLGDALIGLVVAEEMYRLNPTHTEGDLTGLRAALVQGETLARVARSLELGRLLLMGKGEEASGGRERPSNLAAAFEALVGAVFLDQGYRAAREFTLRSLSDELPAAGGRASLKNPKSLVQELVQARGMDVPTYRVVEVTGQDHARVFTVDVVVQGETMGRGKGRRKSIAEREAAQQALSALGERG